MHAEQGQTVRVNSFVSAPRQLIAVRPPDAVFLIQPLGVGAGRRHYGGALKAIGRYYGYWGVATEFGLEHHEAAFRENAIDDDVLRDLTDQDLEKLAVLLGDRRRLLRAIAALDSASAAASSPAPVPSAAAASPTSSTEASVEYRHVTAMFCDLFDLTGIAANLDAEEWGG